MQHFQYSHNGIETWTPESFSEAYSYIKQGCVPSVAIKETLDKFYTSPREKQKAMLAVPICDFSNEDYREQAVYIAALVDQLFHDYKFVDYSGEMWFENGDFVMETDFTSFDLERLSTEQRKQYMENCLPYPKKHRVYIDKNSISFKGFYPPLDWDDKKFERYKNMIPKRKEPAEASPSE